MIHLAPRSGCAFTVPRGAMVKIIDPTGKQVADFVSFGQHDRTEWLSSGRTIDYANSIYIKQGDTLYSNRSRPMWSVQADTVGRHDFLLTPCSPDTFRLLYNDPSPRPSCFGNLVQHLAPFGITPDMIPTTLNVFMDVAIGPDGTLTIGTPRSRAGDYLLLRAEMDQIVGVTACSAELSNNGSFKPIDVEVIAPA